MGTQMGKQELTSMFNDRRGGDRRRDRTSSYLVERPQANRRVSEFSTQPWWLQRSVLDTRAAR